MPTKLGQNFLRNEEVLKKIITSADLKANDNIIEIGPGEGVLTQELIKKAGKVLAVEIDNNLFSALDSRLRGNDNIKIINEDILKINLPELIKKNDFENLPAGRQGYKVIANIPYYITSPIIQLFLETEFPPQEMILMVQKEVAERICSQPGQMSILSISVQYYAKPEILFYVDKKSFYPIPEVDSAVIKISKIKNQESRNSKEETRKFFKVVKAGFSAKRKTLINNLSNSFHIDKKELEEKLAKIKITPRQRAQELRVEDWKKISNLL